MSKIILITGATDGIGLDTAKTLLAQGHRVLLHGRSHNKLRELANELNIEKDDCYYADLEEFEDIYSLCDDLMFLNAKIDVVINNAGVLKADVVKTYNGLDIRFMVNVIAPYIITRQLLPMLDASTRVINVSSAAQATVAMPVLSGRQTCEDMEAYAQSKLAIIMWTNYLASSKDKNMPTFISVNPGSLLATKMVHEGFGIEGNDVHIGGDILARLAIEEEFSHSNGLYYDTDSKQFSSPHADALDADKCSALVSALDTVIRLHQALPDTLEFCEDRLEPF